MSARVNGRAAIRANGTRSERNELIVARVLDDGATLGEAAREFGLSRERVRQLVEQDRATAAAELASLAADEAALALRYRRALGLVDSLDRAERWSLLAAVVWPGDELGNVSRARALAGVGVAVREHRRCRACGIAFGDGYTSGCRCCNDRRRSQRRRTEARARSVNGGGS